MWWFIPLALAEPAPMPASLTVEQLDDVEAWEKRSRVLLDGPESCVEIQGRARTTLALYTPGGWLGPGERRDLVANGTFSGTLDHGKWTRLDTVWEKIDGAKDLDLGRVHPIVGKLAIGAAPAPSGPAGAGQVSGQGEAALGLLDEILSDIDTTISTSYTQWKGELGGVVLYEAIPLKENNGELVMQVLFPNGGDPTQVDAVFPQRIRGGEGFITLTLVDSQLHLRGKPTALGTLPGEEGASTVAGFLGFTLGIDQHLSYDRARPCPPAPPPGPTPDAATPEPAPTP